MKTFKTQIYMNSQTEAYCKRAFGVRRTVWNWALSRFLEEKRKTNNLPSPYDLDKEYRQKCKDQPNGCFAWLAEQDVSGKIMSETLKDVKAAFVLARTQGKKLHKKVKPSFKKKKDRLQTFSMYHAQDRDFRVESKHTLSFATSDRKSRGVVHTYESLQFLDSDSVKLCRMTITLQGGKYWLCVSYEKPNQEKRNQHKPTGKVGIDLGVVISAAAFDGKNYTAKQFMTKASAKSKRLSKKLDRKLSNKQYGSHRCEKMLLLKQRRELRSSAQRNAALEEYTTWLVRNYSEFVIDDFSFKSILKVRKADRKLHEKLYTSMVYAFKQRLEQKAAAAGAIVHYVEHQKGVKTTHKCCRCGSTAVHVDRKTRVLVCHTCNNSMDHDQNAAINTFAL